MLTERGIWFARKAVEGAAAFPLSTARDSVASSDSSTVIDTARSKAVLKPHWEPTQRELRLGDRIVKRFRVPARNQELILKSFEEEGWPAHIDDPLPVTGDIDPSYSIGTTRSIGLIDAKCIRYCDSTATAT